MVDMFEMYKEERSCQVVVGVFDKAACSDDEFDALEPLCVVPPCNTPVLCQHLGTVNHTYHASSNILIIHA